MDSYNAINITLDIYSALITIMISFYLLCRKNNSKENKYFLWICIWNLFFIAGDLSDWCCNGLARSWYPMVLHFGQFLYYTVLVPFLYMMMKYVIEYLSSYVVVSKNYMRITVVAAILHLIGAFVTPFTGLYYVISDENIYYRGKGVYLASIFPILVYLMVVVIVFQFRKVLSLRVKIALLSYVWIPLLGQLIQNCFRGVATLNPAITLAILLMFFNVQIDLDVQHEKDKQKLAETNIKVLLGQIQPHFLYNTLTAIRGMCETNPTLAKELINDFSVFLRANMDSLTNIEPIHFEQELVHVRTYLNLVQQMYAEKIEVEYDIQVSEFYIPALSLQPIVENAVYKGIKKKEGRGRLFIRTEEEEQCYKIVIADDGVGFQLNILKENGHIGIQNVKTRIEAMCGGNVTIDSVIGKGTTVEIKVPKISGGG